MVAGGLVIQIAEKPMFTNVYLYLFLSSLKKPQIFLSGNLEISVFSVALFSSVIS